MGRLALDGGIGADWCWAIAEDWRRLALVRGAVWCLRWGSLFGMALVPLFMFGTDGAAWCRSWLTLVSLIGAGGAD